MVRFASIIPYRDLIFPELARDIQSFEWIPMGAFNSKNFKTSVSPWIVTLDALKPYRTRLPDRVGFPPFLY